MEIAFLVKWLKVVFRTPEPVQEDDLLITPKLYRIDSQGEELGKIEPNEIEI